MPQRYQSKVLRMITDAPYIYITNDMLHRDLKIATIKETIKEFCQRYCDTVKEHPNNLMKAREIVRRLERKRSTDLFYGILNRIFHN